jgi:hypothetical protein
VYHEAVAGLPAWLVWGVALGLLGSLGAAGVFLVGVRAFPEQSRARAERVDGDARRRREIREYLTAIGEAFAEDHPVEGQEVAFYLPERDVAITFDPRAFYRIDRTATCAVLVEHEMPGVNLGYRLPFETPEVDAEPDPGDDRGRSDPRDAAFAVLGLPSGAGTDEVRAAYRRKVKEVHPDHGGDEEEFRRVREAYTTAKRHT